MRRSLVLVAALCAPNAALAQTSPFVPEPLYKELAEEISGDRAFESVRHLTHFHRTGGSRDLFAAAEWIGGAAAPAGLEDVRLVSQAARQPTWSGVSGEAPSQETESCKTLEIINSSAMAVQQHLTLGELIPPFIGSSAMDLLGGWTSISTAKFQAL